MLDPLMFNGLKINNSGTRISDCFNGVDIGIDIWHYLRTN